jgi:hypothetical protein
MAEHSQPLIEGMIALDLRNRRNCVPKIKWNGQVPCLTRAIAKLLAESPAKVGSRRKPDGKGDVADLLSIGDIAEGSMGGHKTVPLNVVMNSAIRLEHLVEAGTRNADLPT